MSSNTLEQVKNLVEQLTPFEQEALMDYLKPRLAQTPDAAQQGETATAKKLSLEDLWRISDELATQENPDAETMTAEFLRTRR